MDPTSLIEWGPAHLRDEAPRSNRRPPDDN